MKKLILAAILPFAWLGSNAQTSDSSTPAAPENYTRKPGTLYMHGCPVFQQPGTEDTVIIIQLAYDIPHPSTMQPGSYLQLYRIDANRMPTADLRDLATLMPRVYQPRRGSNIAISGGRPEEVLYVIDGMRIARH